MLLSPAAHNLEYLLTFLQSPLVLPPLPKLCSLGWSKFNESIVSKEVLCVRCWVRFFSCVSECFCKPHDNDTLYPSSDTPNMDSLSLQAIEFYFYSTTTPTIRVIYKTPFCECTPAPDYSAVLFLSNEDFNSLPFINMPGGFCRSRRSSRNRGICPADFESQETTELEHHDCDSDARSGGVRL